MRTKQCFDKGWSYIIDEVGPLPKTYAKSGIVAGITNAVDDELFEPFAGAGKMRFDKGWSYIIDEVGPLPKTYAKSGIVAGITNAVDDELFEPFAGAGKMLRALQDILPAGDDAKGDVDAANMLMGNLPEKAKSAKNWKKVDLPHDFRVEIGVTEDAVNWAQGYIPDGVAYYRKVFQIPKSTLGKRVVLEFDGVMRNASFWYNVLV